MRLVDVRVAEIGVSLARGPGVEMNITERGGLGAPARA